MNNVISVILPICNEAGIIEKVIDSLLRQQIPGYELELLLIDGKSTDGTPAIIEKKALQDSRIRLLINENRRTPFAFNIGLSEARGDNICILGAHCTYDEDYIAVCLEETEKHGAVGCSGRTVTAPADDTIQAKLVSVVISHPFGVSGKSFRTQRGGYVETIPYPVFRKQALIDVGGYDETLHRNQDNDMNQRLRRAGHKLYCTGKVTCRYHGKKTIEDLLKYAFQSGVWNAVSLKVNPASLSLRHHIPTFFAISIILGILFGITGTIFSSVYLGYCFYLVLGGMLLHLAIGTYIGVGVFNRFRHTAVILLPAVFFLLHFCYGFGTLWGLRFAKQQQGNK